MIPLYVTNGTAYVWNSEDWYTLRVKYRICGALIGSLPSFPRQNDFHGLPMALMTEEAALLVNEGICELISISDINMKPSDDLKKIIDDCENRVIDEQREALRKRKIEQLSQKIEIIVAGKKQKLLSKGISDVDLDKNVLLQEEINKIPNVAPGHLLVHLPTQHQLQCNERTKLSLCDLDPGLETEKRKIKYEVFHDLWKKKYFLTNGSKFGSDFLVYQGDPVKFHATYMVKCTSITTKFRPVNLIAFGRLSVAVNKLAILAYFNNTGAIEYQTLQWHDSVIIVSDFTSSNALRAYYTDFSKGKHTFEIIQEKTKQTFMRRLESAT